MPLRRAAKQFVKLRRKLKNWLLKKQRELKRSSLSWESSSFLSSTIEESNVSGFHFPVELFGLWLKASRSLILETASWLKCSTLAKKKKNLCGHTKGWHWLCQ
ncbi:hypothetical protein Y1Q_0007216 [Alligator mississippiensis]|uniref:Uncharacterized protein n=1 Tax=Alligator mississippiensis TaxID=8496 RepID=A0A151N5W9_ALLMI|nr:hypothetical protein Y1Q_0007216 [Alligator mississippiensis]